MDVSNFPIHQSAHQNVGRTADRSRKSQDIVSLGVCPPTTPHRFSHYQLNEIRDFGACRLHGYPAFFDPRQGLLCVHRSATNHAPYRPATCGKQRCRKNRHSMAKYRIAWMPGDGGAHDVMEAARLVLDRVKLDAESVPCDIAG